MRFGGAPVSATELVRREYDHLAGEYDRRWRRYIDATLQAVLEAVDCSETDALLDIPCGTGELETRLFSLFPGLRIVGSDLSLEMLANACGKDSAGRAQWIAADIGQLPFPHGVFDWAVCANGFHYFDAPQSSLAELRRVLRPNGRLVLIDWCDDYLTCRLCSTWLRWRGAAFHQLYSLRDCTRQLQRAGFFVERRDRFRVGWLWGMMRLVASPAAADSALR